MTSTAKYKTSAPNKPKSCWDLFCSFTLMAMQAFGGSTAIAQQFLVDQKKWLTQSEFLDLLTVSQVLPGPNIMILTIVVGDRHFGWRGALASFLGMIRFRQRSCSPSLSSINSTQRTNGYPMLWSVWPHLPQGWWPAPP